MGRLRRRTGLRDAQCQRALQTDICFAALFILVLLTILLWLAVDALLHRLINWTPE
jgi:ABC-type nitrate/sulfonate/bicarbonate transport system permease component